MPIIENWKLVVLSRYAKFDGRAGRAEFWWFVLANVIVYVALAALSAASEIFSLLLLAYVVGIFVPSLAVAIRRLHDTSRSGWWLLLGMVPCIGLILIVFYALPGTPGPNQFGPAPDGTPMANPAMAAPYAGAGTPAPYAGAGAPAPVAPPAAGRGGWAPDPYGRYTHRYFDGRQWTSNVSTAGASAVDEPGFHAPSSTMNGWAPDPFGRYAQRYHDGSRWSEHVIGPGGAQLTDSPIVPAPTFPDAPPNPV